MFALSRFKIANGHWTTKLCYDVLAEFRDAAAAKAFPCSKERSEQCRNANAGSLVLFFLPVGISRGNFFSSTAISSVEALL